MQKGWNFWFAEPMPQANHCFYYKSQLIITFPRSLKNMNFHMSTFGFPWKSLKITKKPLPVTPYGLRFFVIFVHMPLREPFGASIAMKTMFCPKIHVHLSSCRKRSRACIVMKSKLLGIARKFHRAPLDLLRASLFHLSATPKTSKMLTR